MRRYQLCRLSLFFPAVALTVACSGDSGTSASETDPSSTVTQPTIPTSTSTTTEGSNSNTESTTVGPTGTDSESISSSGSDTTDGTSGTDSSTAGPTTDPSGTDSSSTGEPPGTLDCSPDLHDIINEMGEVVETCPPEEGCLDGMCVDACLAAEAIGGTIGCDFWAPTPPFVFNGGQAQQNGPCHAVFIANAWSGPVNVTISRDGQSFDVAQYGRIPVVNGQNVMYDPIPPEGLPPDEVAIMFLAHRPGTQNATSLECPIPPAVLEDTAVSAAGIGSAFHVETDRPVSAYDILPYGGASSYLPSATLLFPATSWDDNYYAIAPLPSNDGRWIHVVAREDNTLVKVAPQSPFPGGNGVAPAPANQTTEYMLNAGEILQWAQQSGDFEPTSAVFESDKPIGMWTGNTYMFVASATSQGPGGGESAHQQIAPISALGNEYVGAGIVTRLINDGPESVPYKMVAAIDGTMLEYDPAAPNGAPAMLDAGQVAEFETTVPFTVRSQDPDHPFLFTQYMPGTWAGGKPGCQGNPNNPCPLGDEEWVSLLSSLQYQNRYVFFTDPTYSTTNLVIVRVQGENGFSDVEIECLNDPVSGWQPVGNEGMYEYAHVDLIRGSVPVDNCGTSRHIAESEEPFGIVVWGTDYYASYGYPAGSNLSKVNEVIIPVPQ